MAKPLGRISQLKSILMILLKVVVSFGSLLVVTRSIAWPEVGRVLRHANYSLMFLALTVFLVAQVFSSLRCVYVARVLGGRIDLSTSLRAHFVGLWFNQVLPTSLGGDVVKIALLRKCLGLSVAIRSTILDRLSGLVFLLLAIAITLPLYANLFPHDPKLVVALGFLSVGGGAAVVIGALVAHRISNLPFLNSFSLNLIRIFSDVWSFRKGNPLFGQTWTSAIVYFNGIATYALLGIALGVQINLMTFALLVPVVFLIALVPVSFAGWGLREAGTVWLFGLVGIDNESALTMSVCFGLLLVFAGVPGLLFFLQQSLIRSGDSDEACSTSIKLGHQE